MKISTRTIVAAAAAVFVLAACGGGGGSSTPASTSSPSSGSTSTSSPAPAGTSNYAAGSVQAAAFSTLNQYRAALGVGKVDQDTRLDTSASAHAAYLEQGFSSGSLSALTHDETGGQPGFTGATPLSRATLAGVPAGEYVGEDIGDGAATTTATAEGQNCVFNLLATVYHQQGLMAPAQTIGMGFGTAGFGFFCVLDQGQTAGVSGTPSGNGWDVYGTQVLPTTVIAHLPLANETGVLTTMHSESPNPAPDLTTPGRPLMVMVAANQQGDVLTVSSFTVTGPSGLVAGRILVPSGAVGGSTGVTGDPNGILAPGVAFFLPLSPLTVNTTYTVSFNGARDGTPISSSWTFATGTL